MVFSLHFFALYTFQEQSNKPFEYLECVEVVTEQLKQKNHLYYHSSVAVALTSSKMKPTVPSTSSNEISDDLYEFLGNHSFRKKYNKVLNLAKKFRNLQAKIDFLKTCIEEKLICSDFKLSKP